MGEYLYQFARMILPNYKLGGLKHQKFIVSEFRRLELLNQGVGRATFLFEGSSEYYPSLPPF